MTPDINSPQPPLRPRPVTSESPPSFQPTVPSPPRPTIGRTRTKKPFFLTLLVFILIGGAGYGAYAVEHSRAITAEKAQQAQITILQKQADSLHQQADKSTTASTATPAASGTSTFKVSQLGVEILNVPTSLADLTDSTISGNTTGMYFSTSSLTTADSGCSAAHGGIGALGRQSGVYSSSAASAGSGQFVKQFSGFWVSYSHPQAACSANATATSLQQSQAAAFQSLATNAANIQLIPN